MELIYQNFDGLDFSVNGAFPENILAVLREAKAQSLKRHGEHVLTYIGAAHLPIHIYPTGAKGGYTFTFDTGPDGAIWFVKDTTIPRAGNIRISCSSLSLALDGYERTRNSLLVLLTDLGVTGLFDNDEQNARLVPSSKCTVGRFDYCFDFIMDDDFNPDPRHFIIHSRSKARGEIGEKPLFEVQGGYFQSVMLGKMPNRQMIIYDKTAEIKDHNKPYWWDIWGLNPETFKGSIWRVESRAGKDELDSWGIKSFKIFDLALGDLILHNFMHTRYAIPCPDTNRSRWATHPLWEACQEATKNALAPHISNTTRKKVITDLREVITERARRNFRGSIATFNHLLGHNPEDVFKTIEFIANDVLTFAEENPKDFRKKVKKAKDRHVFLNEEPKAD